MSTTFHPKDDPTYPDPDSEFWSSEIGAWFVDHPGTFTKIVMTGSQWGLGQDVAEAFRNAGVRRRKTDSIGEWDRPVQAVVDGFGRIHWLPSSAVLTWTQGGER